jgi:membrane protein DedA with SNARE-associated domain
MEEFQLILDQYGLWAVAFGAFFQGYVFVIAAGIFASQGVFRLVDVVVVAAVSSWIGHWVFYLIGSGFSRRRSFLEKTRLYKPIQTFDSTVKCHPWTSVFIMQYGHGIRIVAATAFGFFKINPVWFAWAQAINCAVWAILLFYLGYFAGIGLFALPSYAHLPTAITVITLLVIAYIFRKHWLANSEKIADDDKYEKVATFIEKESLP